MTTCLILDDDRQSVGVLQSYIDKVASLKLIGIASSFTESIDFISSEKIEILFLGNKLHDEDFKQLTHQPSHLIILDEIYTHDIHNSCCNRLLQWLEKPLKFTNFLNAYHKVIEYEAIRHDKTNGVAPSNSKDYIFIKTENKGKFVKVSIDDICYIEGLGNYLTINTINGTKIITYTTFNEILEVLPNSFIRVHKSFLVSLNYVDAIDGNQLKISDRSEPIPLGLAYRANLFHIVENKIIGGKKSLKINNSFI